MNWESKLSYGAVLIGLFSMCCVSAVAWADDAGGLSGEVAAPAELQEMTQTIAAALSMVSLDGWHASDIERYVVANLYDKIDGRSELYMSYGVKGMVFTSFVNDADHSQFIDVFLYDMESAPGAFGVFSVERWGEWETLDLGRQGYRKDSDVFFWKGPYYATVLGSGKEPAVRDAQLAIARELDTRLKDSGESLWGFDVLPKEGLVKDSVQYFMVDALSLGFMNNTYTAEYEVGDETVTVFVSQQESDAAARETYEQFVAYMKKYGKDVDSTGTNGDDLVTADMGGAHYDGVFRCATYVAGVSSVPNRTLAIQAAQRLREGIEGGSASK